MAPPAAPRVGGVDRRDPRDIDSPAPVNGCCCTPLFCISCLCSGLQLRRSQARQPTMGHAACVTTAEPTPATPPGAPLSFGRANMPITGHHLHQQPHRSAHTGGDTPRLRPLIGPGHPLASSHDISSGHDYDTLHEDDTHGSGENAQRPSGSGTRTHPPELPPPVLLSHPHRPPEVEQPSPHPFPTITNPNWAESQYAGLISDLNNNMINRRDDQPVREYNLTTFLSRMGLGFPDPDLKALIRTNQRTI